LILKNCQNSNPYQKIESDLMIIKIMIVKEAIVLTINLSKAL